MNKIRVKVITTILSAALIALICAVSIATAVRAEEPITANAEEQNETGLDEQMETAQTETDAGIPEAALLYPDDFPDGNYYVTVSLRNEDADEDSAWNVLLECQDQALVTVKEKAAIKLLFDEELALDPFELTEPLLTRDNFSYLPIHALITDLNMQSETVNENSDPEDQLLLLCLDWNTAVPTEDKEYNKENADAIRLSKMNTPEDAMGKEELSFEGEAEFGSELAGDKTITEPNSENSIDRDSYSLQLQNCDNFEVVLKKDGSLQLMEQEKDEITSAEDDANLSLQEEEDAANGALYKDNDTGIRVDDSGTNLPSGVELVVKELKSGDTYDSIKDKTYIQGNKFVVYSIRFQDADGNDVEPTGKLTLSIPYSEEWDETKLWLIRFDDDGTATTLSGEVTDDGVYAADTAIFSNFALVERLVGGEETTTTKPNETTTTRDNTKTTRATLTTRSTLATSGVGATAGSTNAAKTGDESNFILWLILLVAAAGAATAALIYSRKHTSQ